MCFADHFKDFDSKAKKTTAPQTPVFEESKAYFEHYSILILRFPFDNIPFRHDTAAQLQGDAVAGAARVLKMSGGEKNDFVRLRRAL